MSGIVNFFRGNNNNNQNYNNQNYNNQNFNNNQYNYNDQNFNNNNNGWHQNQTQIYYQEQDQVVIQRTKFLKHFDDVIKTLKRYENSLNDVIKKNNNNNNNNNNNASNILLSGNIIASGSINTITPIILLRRKNNNDNDKTTMDLAVNRAMDYYNKLKDDKKTNPMVSKQVLPLLVYLMKSLKGEKVGNIPTPKVKEFNQYLVDSALEKWVETQEIVQEEYKEIKQNVKKYKKSQQNEINNQKTKKNISDFNKLNLKNKNYTTKELLQNVPENEIDYEMNDRLNKTLGDNISHILSGDTDNDDMDIDVKDQINLTAHNLALNKNPFSIEQLKKLKKGNKIDCIDVQNRWLPCKVTRILDKGIEIQYEGYSSEYNHEILWTQCYKVAKYKSLSYHNAKKPIFQPGYIFYILNNYFDIDDSTGEGFQEVTFRKFDRNSTQICFTCDIYGSPKSRWIHSDDPNFCYRKPMNQD